MKMAYLFKKFDFDEFNKGKLYMVKEAKEKYKWDREKMKETDEYEGVQLILEIKQDDYEYETKDGIVTGVNLNEEFQVLIPDGKIEDYEKLVARGFEAPVPVKVEGIQNAELFESKGKKPVLKVWADDVVKTTIDQSPSVGINF